MTNFEKTIQCSRIYYKTSDCGYRILVDRLWPRGIRKEDAAIDLWAKDIAPSNDLRKWFGHDPEKYVEFSKRYQRELEASAAAAEFSAFCRNKLKEQDIVLLYAAKDEAHNNAIALKKWLTDRFLEKKL